MKANRAFRLLVRRGGLMPAALADPGRVDHVELVEIASGEVLLFWDLPPRAAARLARSLRSDLAQCSEQELRQRWVETADPSERIEGGWAGGGGPDEIA